jgi:hypothetical protein
VNTPFDSGTSAVEKLLHDRMRHAPPPALRSRVLAAVEEALPKKVPGTKCGQDAQSHDPQYADLADLVPGTFFFFFFTALSLLLVMILSRDVASHRAGSATERPMLSFAQRAKAAGITLDVAAPSTSHMAGRGTHDDGARPHDILRSIDTHRFLQGEL